MADFVRYYEDENAQGVSKMFGDAKHEVALTNAGQNLVIHFSNISNCFVAGQYMKSRKTTISMEYTYLDELRQVLSQLPFELKKMKGEKMVQSSPENKKGKRNDIKRKAPEEFNNEEEPVMKKRKLTPLRVKLFRENGKWKRSDETKENIPPPNSTVNVGNLIYPKLTTDHLTDYPHMRALLNSGRGERQQLYTLFQKQNQAHLSSQQEHRPEKQAPLPSQQTQLHQQKQHWANQQNQGPLPSQQEHCPEKQAPLPSEQNQLHQQKQHWPDQQNQAPLPSQLQLHQQKQDCPDQQNQAPLPSQLQLHQQKQDCPDQQNQAPLPSQVQLQQQNQQEHTPATDMVVTELQLFPNMDLSMLTENLDFTQFFIE